MTPQAIDAFAKNLFVGLLMQQSIINNLRNPVSREKLNLQMQAIEKNSMQCAIDLKADFSEEKKNKFVKMHQQLSFQLDLAIVLYSELPQERRAPSVRMPAAIPSRQKKLPAYSDLPIKINHALRP